MLLSSQKFLTQPTLINLHPMECSEEFHNHPFSLKLDRCVESCNKYVLGTKQNIKSKRVQYDYMSK